MFAYRLRAARDADRDRIAEIWHASASLPDVGPPVMPGREDLRRRVHAEMDGGGWTVTVAETDEEIVGFAALRIAEGILAELFLCPDHLGAGLGKRLLDHAKAEMPGGFRLFTTSANARARRFYEREGLVATHETPHPRSGHPVTHYEWRGA